MTTVNIGLPCLTDFAVDEAALVQLMNLGFSRNHVIRALQETGNNVERAADWVFNHPDEVVESEPMDQSPASKTETPQGESSSASESDYRELFFRVIHYFCVKIPDSFIR